MNHDRYTELQAKRDELEAKITQARASHAPVCKLYEQAIALTNEVLRMEISNGRK